MLLSVSATAVGSSLGTATAQPSPTLRDAAAISDTVVGVGIDGELLAEPSYASIAGYEFSGAAPGEAAAWNVIATAQGSYDWSRLDQVMDFARLNNQGVYGLPLVWDEQLPAWLTGLDAEQLRAATADHFATVMGRYPGQVDRWDVVVNPLAADGTLRDTLHRRSLGEDYLAEVLQAARDADPSATLYLAEDGIGDLNSAKGEGMYRLVSALLAQGVPIDGIGFQGHLELGAVPEGLLDTFQAYADLGLEVALTDLHVAVELPREAPIDDPRLAQQARDYAAVVTACVTAPNCGEVTLGAVTDDRADWGSGQDPVPSNYLWDLDYVTKSAYYTAQQAFIGAP